MADPDLRRRGEAFNRTLRTVERDLERAYFGETEVGPYDDPLGPGIVADVLIAARSLDDRRADALARLRRAYRSDERLTRALANTTTTDIAGLLGALALPEWIFESVARRSGWAEILLSRIATVPLEFNAGYPWLPDLPPATRSSSRSWSP